VRQLFLAIFERLAADIDRHVVDAADAGAGVVDDIGHRGGGESAGGEHVGRGVEYALLCRIGLRPAPRLRCREASRPRRRQPSHQREPRSSCDEAKSGELNGPLPFEANARAYLDAMWSYRRAVMVLASGHTPTGFDGVRRSNILRGFRRWMSVLELDIRRAASY
jgi:hypothetical protein